MLYWRRIRGGFRRARCTGAKPANGAQTVETATEGAAETTAIAASKASRLVDRTLMRTSVAARNGACAPRDKSVSTTAFDSVAGLSLLVGAVIVARSGHDSSACRVATATTDDGTTTSRDKRIGRSAPMRLSINQERLRLPMNGTLPLRLSREYSAVRSHAKLDAELRWLS